MTAREVADFLRVNLKTVYDARKRGELPGTRIGRLFRFHREDVVALARGIFRRTSKTKK
jgi:excisionase family DNA binding protein